LKQSFTACMHTLADSNNCIRIRGKTLVPSSSQWDTYSTYTISVP